MSAQSASKWPECILKVNFWGGKEYPEHTKQWNAKSSLRIIKSKGEKLLHVLTLLIMQLRDFEFMHATNWDKFSWIIEKEKEESEEFSTNESYDTYHLVMRSRLKGFMLMF